MCQTPDKTPCRKPNSKSCWTAKPSTVVTHGILWRCALPRRCMSPFEEQFDLPAAFVERSDGGSRQPELIGEEHQLLSRFGVPEADAPQVFGVMLGGVVAVQRDGLIANDAGR